MEYVSEFPLSHMDWRPRKRPRLAWEVPQAQPKVQFLLVSFFMDFLSLFVCLCFSFFFFFFFFNIIFFLGSVPRAGKYFRENVSIGETCVRKISWKFFRMINFLYGLSYEENLLTLINFSLLSFRLFLVLDGMCRRKWKFFTHMNRNADF
jgi:hypothetical protein